MSTILVAVPVEKADPRLVPRKLRQTRAVLSAEAVTTRWPSGLNTADVTESVCPCSTARLRPEAASHTRAVLSSDMCGRFTMTRRDRTEVAALVGIPELGDYTPRFNIAPTQPYLVFKTKYESREAIPATWGLVNSWAKDASRASMCINAKAETVDKLPSFRKAFEKRRCIVPADDFYES